MSWPAKLLRHAELDIYVVHFDAFLLSLYISKHNVTTGRTFCVSLYCVEYSHSLRFLFLG